jgi:thioredoxin-like negative regulator of GroEL
LLISGVLVRPVPHGCAGARTRRALECRAVVVLKGQHEALGDLAGRFGIRSIPTLAVMHNGHEIARAAGARGAADIERFVIDSLAAEHQHAS